MAISITRRLFVGGAPLVLLGAGGIAAAATPAPGRLLTLPTRVYRSMANDREGIAATVFFLILETPDPAPRTPAELRLAYRAATTVVKEERFDGASLDRMALRQLPPTRLTGRPPEPPVQWPLAFRIHAYWPAAAGVETLAVTLRCEGAGGEVRLDIPVAEYAQRTRLVFPFRGEGLISSGGVLAGGHRNRSGLYAIDALGLTPQYAPMVGAPNDERPSAYAGWGRPILAPAAGTIVRARSDRPDQPRTDHSDPAYFAPEFPDGGDPGNHVVIDHGQSEFSMIAHMQAGSVAVLEGDRVEQGQRLGLLGNSGDTSGPHVHYQLQAGPDWQYADALPFAFDNVRSLARGSYFAAT